MMTNDNQVTFSALYDEVAEIATLKAEIVQLKTNIAAPIDDGELWSIIREVLSQGHAQQMDYMAGKYHRYEEFSARVDGAARERVSAFMALLTHKAAT